MKQLADLYRAAVNPRARRTHSVAITLATGCRTLFSCVCGSTHSEAASVWVPGHGRIGLPRYQAAYARWAAGHAGCMAHAVERAMPGTMAGYLTLTDVGPGVMAMT